MKIFSRFFFTFKESQNIKYLLLDSLSEELIDYLEIKNNFYVLKNDKKPLYINIVFFALLLKFFFLYLFLKIPKKINFLSLVYHVSLIKFLKPKYILNFLDNSLLFSYLDLKLKHKNFITIQNGFRCELNFQNNKFFYSNICFFSELDKKKFEMYNCKIKDYLILGPIRALYYKEKKEVYNEIVEDYDICFISQYPGIYNFSKNQLLLNNIKDGIFKLSDYLNKIRIQEKKKVIILMRGNSLDEKNFYKNFGFCDENLLQRNHNSFWQTYHVIMKSKLTLGFTTSCVQEAWSMGKKAAICDLTNVTNFNNFDLNLIIRDVNYSSFSKKILQLLSIKDNDFKKKFSNEFNNYSVNFKINSLSILRNKINEKNI